MGVQKLLVTSLQDDACGGLRRMCCPLTQQHAVACGRRLHALANTLPMGAASKSVSAVQTLCSCGLARANLVADKGRRSSLVLCSFRGRRKAL